MVDFWDLPDYKEIEHKLALVFNNFDYNLGRILRIERNFAFRAVVVRDQATFAPATSATPGCY
jgi:hypothetical protein